MHITILDCCQWVPWKLHSIFFHSYYCLILHVFKSIDQIGILCVPWTAWGHSWWVADPLYLKLSVLVGMNWSRRLHCTPGERSFVWGFFLWKCYKGAPAPFLHKSVVAFNKLLVFPFCQGCHLDLPFCKFINKVVKLVVCHDYLDLEPPLVVVGKCFFKLFEKRFCFIVNNCFHSGEVQVLWDGGEKCDCIDK